MRPGDRVVKLLSAGGLETASLHEVTAVCKRRGLLSIDPAVKTARSIEPDGVQTYRLVDGRANACYLPGCSTRIVPLEE
jgi:hypothetical protein